MKCKAIRHILNCINTQDTIYCMRKVALQCWVATHSEISLARFVRIGKNVLPGQLTEGALYCCCSPFYFYTADEKKLIQLEKDTFWGPTFLPNPSFLRRSADSSHASHNDKKSTHITVYLLNTPSKTSFILKVRFYHCNCIYIEGFHWQSCSRQGWTCWLTQLSQAFVAEMTL